MSGSAAGNDEAAAKLAQFRDVTGADGERATFYLESSNWELETALGSFFEEDGDAPVPVPAEKKQQAAAARRSSSSSDSEEEGQAFYAGGSSTSGQQILGPPKKKKSGEAFVKDLFKKAREHGAEVVSDQSSSSGSGRQRTNAFTGVGFKLGSSGSATSEQVEGQPVAKPPREFVLKMWKNGFSIDDGDVRPYNSQENRAFLAAVMSGRIPEELVGLAEGGEVHVDMEDHKEEEFKGRPSGARKAFTGSGHVLGGVTPTLVTDGATSQPLAADPDSEKHAQEALKVSDSEPVTSIQIRLPDGKRLVARVNHSHTVADLRRFIETARPDYPRFTLHTTFPPKELTDGNASVKDAGLIGAAVLLRKG